MRFGSGLWALAVLPAVTLTLAVPSPTIKPYEFAWSGERFLAFDARQAKATFTVPCTGCNSEQSDDESLLTFDFQAFLSDHPCGASNTTLNGQYLAQNWDGLTAHGSGAVPSLVPEPKPVNVLDTSGVDLHLSWQTTCLFHGPPSEHTFSPGEEVAQVLTVTVDRIGDRAIPAPQPGFSISYRTSSGPELLRLTGSPTYDAGQNDLECWLNPSEPNCVTTPTVDQDPSLASQIEELRRLEEEAQRIQDRINEQKKLIKTLFGHSINGLTEEVEHCDTFSCVVSAIAKKTKGAFSIAYAKFLFLAKHHHGHTGTMAHPDASRFSHGPGGQAIGFTASSQPQKSTYPDEKTGYNILADEINPHSQQPAHSETNALALALEILAGVLGLTGLFALLRRLLSRRKRAERMAAREERTRARSYDQSGRHHGMRSWFSRRRSPERDCEEKAALVSTQEGVLEAALQEEIRQFARAHEVVESLVEESRVSATFSRTQHRVSQTLSRVDSLPDYGSDSGMSEPPEYQTDEDDSDLVVDGFRQYAPSRTSSTWTPASTIPDVSPRESGETIRSIYMRA